MLWTTVRTLPTNTQDTITLTALVTLDLEKLFVSGEEKATQMLLDILIGGKEGCTRFQIPVEYALMRLKSR